MSDSTPINLIQLRRKPFVPTKRTEEYTERLLRQLGLPDKATVGRLALGRSLAVAASPPDISELASEGVGKSIKGDTLFGDDLAVWISLIVEHASEHAGADTGLSFDSLVESVRQHWDRGTALLWKDWQESGGLSPFLQRLSVLASLPEHGPASVGLRRYEVDWSEERPAVPAVLRLGEIGLVSGTSRPAEWILNKNGMAPHFGMFGKPGKGKTRTAKDLFQQLRSYGIPLLIIDPKGELREEAGFLREIGASVIGVGREAIPLDALACGADGSMVRVADGFVEALKGAVPQLGPKQLDAVREITKQLVGSSDVVRFEDIVDEVDAHYARNDLKVDVLTASLHKLRDYALFEPTHNPGEFFSKTWVISVNEATDEALRFALLFLLDSLLRHLRASPEAPVDHVAGVRALRLVLAVDEARRIMDVASPELLEGLVLECRSKGLSCMFISQSPDHMDRASDDIIKQLEVVASFEADVASRAMRRLFGSKAKPSDLQRLPTGHLLARMPEEDEAIVIKAWE